VGYLQSQSVELQDPVREAARTLPHTESRSARRDSRHRRPSSQVMDPCVCTRRGLGSRNLEVVIWNSNSKFQILDYELLDDPKGRDRSPVSGGHLDRIVARREWRQRELRRVPPRSVAVVAQRGSNGNGQQFSRAVEQPRRDGIGRRGGDLDAHLLVSAEPEVGGRPISIRG